MFKGKKGFLSNYQLFLIILLFILIMLLLFGLIGYQKAIADGSNVCEFGFARLCWSWS